MPAAALSRPIKVGTDCSGMETPLMAMNRLSVAYKHQFSCDICPYVKRYLQFAFPEGTFFDDLMNRDNKNEVPDLDLYIAGFPCQSFSMAGKRKGFQDKRGQVFFGVKDLIDKRRPRAFILENVKGLINHEGGKTMATVMSELRGIKDNRAEAYEVTYKVLNTLEHGVPQNRERVYIIGILKSCKRFDFEWPEPLPPASVEDFLEPVQGAVTKSNLPPTSNRTAHRNVLQKLRALEKDGEDPLNETFFIDCDSSEKFCSVMKGKSMCMTKSRASGFWITSHGRRATLNDQLRLQGMDPNFVNLKKPMSVSRLQMGAMVGNAMSQNVVERIMVRLLPASGLVKEPIQDPWETKGRKRVSSALAPAAKRAKVCN